MTLLLKKKTFYFSQLVVELMYENLANDFPTRVKIIEKDNHSLSLMRDYSNEEDIFLKNRLPEAYKLAF